MANKIFNMEGGKHSAAAYSAFENEVFGGNAVASSNALKVTAESAMTVKVAKGNGLIDTGDMYSRRIQVSTDTNLTISTADTSLPRIDYVVIYVDNSVRPSTDQLDNTNNILKIVDVKGTPAASPAKPTESAIQTAIGAGNPYMVLASIYIAAGATSISNSNIEDERPASPNVYYAPTLYTLNGGSPKPWNETVYATTTVPAGLYLLTMNVRISTGGSGSYGQWAFLREGSTTSGTEILRAGAWGHFDQVFTVSAIVRLDGGDYVLTGQADDNANSTFINLKAYMLKVG